MVEHFEQASKRSKDRHSLVGFMDGDGQFDPADAGVLIERMLAEDTDAALGIRGERATSAHRGC